MFGEDNKETTRLAARSYCYNMLIALADSIVAHHLAWQVINTDMVACHFRLILLTTGFMSLDRERRVIVSSQREERPGCRLLNCKAKKH